MKIGLSPHPIKNIQLTSYCAYAYIMAKNFSFLDTSYIIEILDDISFRKIKLYISWSTIYKIYEKLVQF